jgi:iron complex outermembrane receptor protein
MQILKLICFYALLAAVFVPSQSIAQNSGTVRGTVTLFGEDSPIHGVPIRIVELNRSTLTEDDGSYEFTNVPSGSFSVQAHMDGFRDVVNIVTVGGDTVTSDFQLRLLGLREEITVTASGREEVAYQSFKVVSTLDSVELAENAHTSLGEVLENQPGIAKRSFGPGSSRPVIRGFDGDRVLILEDGVRTGSLSSQSGDHAEPIDPLELDSVEVVKGPATLLYGSNALGGVVNAITRQEHAHPGFRGTLTGVGSTTNEQGGGHGSFEYGAGNWLVWGGGGGQRTGNYETPIGEVLNSESRIASADAGAGWFGERTYLSVGYGYEDSRYGIPSGVESEEEEEPTPGEEEEEVVDLTMHRHNVPFRFGVRNLATNGSWLDAVRASFNYTDYHHEELEGEEVGTTFDNKVVNYRTSFDQGSTGVLSGSFGFDGWWRDYESIGAEALAPPVTSHAFALFGLEEFNLGRYRLQLGARYENTQYNPELLEDRSFNAFSGSAGVQVSTWEGGNFLLSYTHSGRAPALEELYNNGPHPGNVTFEIGNPDLELERSDGIEFSLRHSSETVRGDANFYYYSLGDFVFLAPTGEEEDGLNVAEYSQADSQFVGGELRLDVGLHPSFWLNLGLDAVSAQLKEDDTPLPRIPPLRGRLGFEALYKGLRVKPEVLLADAQDELFPTETRTAGYATFNLNASYTVARQHIMHILSVDAFNLGDRLYRNHLSFIKDIAPEIGRGVRFSYTLRFF